MYWLCTIGSHKCIKCPKNCAKLAARCLDSKNNTFAVFSVCIFWYWAWDEFSVRWDSLNGMRKGGADLEKKIKPCSVLYHIFSARSDGQSSDVFSVPVTSHCAVLPGCSG